MSKKTIYIPTINCGYQAGETPSCYDGTIFNTEEECNKWIDGCIEDGIFDAEEFAGGIYPMAFEFAENETAESFLDVELEDDDTECGGKSYCDETLGEFLDSVDIPHETPMVIVNKVLKGNGIMPIKYWRNDNEVQA